MASTDHPGHPVAVLLVSCAVLLASACGGSAGDGSAGATPTVLVGGPPGELVVLAEEPVGFDFAPDGRLFFNLRQEGEVRWVDTTMPPRGRFDRGEFFAHVETYSEGECGLLGLAVDPEFEANGYVYVYVTQPDASTESPAKPRVIRFTDVDGEGTDPMVIIDDLPPTNPEICGHVGGNLHFGPDGYLYVSIGNNERLPAAQDLSSPLGKVLRVNREDGSAAPDNPFVEDPGADPRVYAYGLRNPFDFAFHPETGAIYGPDNGPGTCDELNIIEAGSDYGVPGSLPPPAGPGASCLGLGGVDPVYLFARPGTTPEEPGSNVAPAGVAFTRAGVYERLGTGLLVCEFNTGFLRHLELEGAGQRTVARDVVLHEFCAFNVEVDAGGIIYYTQARSLDIETGVVNGIYRLTPEDIAELLPP